MFIQIFGDKGKTEKHQLDSGKNNFHKGSTDLFGIEDVDVGDVKKISIGHDNKVR